MTQANDIAMLADMAQYMHNDYSSLPAGYTAADFPHADMPNLYWWYWNGGESDTGGIVGNDWTTVSTSVASQAMPWRAGRLWQILSFWTCQYVMAALFVKQAQS